MKFLDYKSSGNPTMDAKINAAIGKTMTRFGQSLLISHKWRVIVKMAVKDAKDPFYTITAVGTDEEDALEAVTKMEMLETCDWLAATGIANADIGELSDIIDILSAEGRIPDEDGTAIVDELAKTEYLDAISEQGWQLLAKNHLTGEAGGIRIPYSNFISKTEGNTQPVEGEILIAVAGAESTTDYINTMLAFYIAAYIREIMDDEWKNDFVIFDLSDLQTHPVTNVWLELFQIKAT